MCARIPRRRRAGPVRLRRQVTTGQAVPKHSLRGICPVHPALGEALMLCRSGGAAEHLLLAQRASASGRRDVCCWHIYKGPIIPTFQQNRRDPAKPGRNLSRSILSEQCKPSTPLLPTDTGIGGCASSQPAIIVRGCPPQRAAFLPSAQRSASPCYPLAVPSLVPRPPASERSGRPGGGIKWVRPPSTCAGAIQSVERS